MANELKATYSTGETLYVLIFDVAGQVYQAGVGFGAYAAASIDSYDIAMSEIATASGQYRGTFPVIAAGVYTVLLYLQSGGSPASTDIRIGEAATMYWDGTAEITQNMIDTVLDTAAADVAGLDGDAMVGTNGANTVVPDVAGTAATLHGITDGKIDVVDANVDQIETVVITNAAGVDIAADIIALKADTAAILIDTDTMEADLKAYLLSDVIGADSDTLETLSDQLDILGAGSGGTTETYTVTDSVTGLPIDGVHVWVSSDAAGVNIIWAGYTNAAGVVNFYHDLAAGTTIYLWRELAGYTFSNPDSEVTS